MAHHKYSSHPHQNLTQRQSSHDIHFSPFRRISNQRILQSSDDYNDTAIQRNAARN
jgi:hypothetical protein